MKGETKAEKDGSNPIPRLRISIDGDRSRPISFFPVKKASISMKGQVEVNFLSIQ